MTQHLTEKMLTGFTWEVHSYLPQIRASIDSLHTQTPQDTALQEASRYIHTIKGAAAMLGLSALSHMTSYIEETLTEVVTGQGQRDPACRVWLHYALDRIEGYLESLRVGDGCHQAMVTDVVQAFRRFKGLPAADDAAAVAAILAAEAAPLAEAGPAGHHVATAPGDTRAALSSTRDDAAGQVYGQGAPSPARCEADDRADQTERYVTITLAGSRYAVSVSYVLEIGRVLPVTPVPHVPTWLRGIVNVRGDILSVINVRTFLGYAESHEGEQTRMLIVKARGHEITTSLVVDQVLGIVPLSTARPDVPTAPTYGKAAPYLSGTCEHGGQVVAVFDLERLLQSPEVRQFE